MRRTNCTKNDKLVAVNIDTLASMLNCGKTTAIRIGNGSGARIKIGRRVLYKLDKIDAYLNELTEV